MSKKVISINQQVMWIILVCLIIFCLSQLLDPTINSSAIKNQTPTNQSLNVDNKQHQLQENSLVNNAIENITALTDENAIINYIQSNNQLPSFYITKNQAQELGWDSQAGDLCHVLPGKAIGGDEFYNRENKLPSESLRRWYEADINYHCGFRGAERILYSNDGLIFITRDHYRTFEPIE